MIALLAAVALADPLVDAATAGDVAAIERALADGADPNVTVVLTKSWKGGFFGLGKRRTSETETNPVHQALAHALETGDTRALVKLLAKGGDPNRRTAAYPPPLHRVAAALSEKGARKATTALLAGGADPTGSFRYRAVTSALPDDADATWFLDALLRAGADASALLCDASSMGTLEALLSKGADPNADCFARPPLVRAASASSAPALKKLLAAGARLDAVGVVDGLPMTALHAAAAVGFVEGIDLLVAAGASPDAPAGLLGGPPLTVAGTEEAAVALATHGARRSSTHPFHGPPVWFAREPDPEETAAILASHGEDAAVALPVALLDLPLDAVTAKVDEHGTAGFERLARGLSVDDLTAALTFAWGPACPFPQYTPTIAELEVILGPRVSRTRGVTRVTVAFERGEADVWRRGYGKGLAELRDACPTGGEALVGLPRAAVHLALGLPEATGAARDTYDHGLFVSYEGDRATGWGRAW